MHIEHIGLNVRDTAAMADWYVAHLGMRIVQARDEGVPLRFLADSSGQVMIELYSNPAAPMPDFGAMDPLELHVAFRSDDVPGDFRRLLAAGATSAREPEVTPSGVHIAVVRDPWGFAVQLAKRPKPTA